MWVATIKFSMHTYNQLYFQLNHSFILESAPTEAESQTSLETGSQVAAEIQSQTSMETDFQDVAPHKNTSDHSELVVTNNNACSPNLTRYYTSVSTLKISHI